MGNLRYPEVAYYSDWLYLPKSKFHVPAIKAAFTFETYRKGRVSNRVEAYKEDDAYIIVPREFYSEEKLRSIGVRLERQVPDSYEHVEFEDRITLLNDVQRDAYKAMLWAGNGVLQLFCGGGKSIIALKYVAYLGVPTIVVVPTADIMEQWREFAKQFLGVEAGIIRGEDKSKWVWKKPFVLSMIQPLSKLSETLSMDFRKWFGLALFDECFPGKTKVRTEHGEKSIEWIVKTRYTGRVACLTKMGKLTWCSVYNWYERKAPGRLIKLCSSNSKWHPRVSVTPNHEFFDVSGKILRASEITPGVILRFYPKITKGNSYRNALGDMQKQVALGTALGDGNIGGGRLRCNHGQKQRLYAEYKASILQAHPVKGAISGYTGKSLCGHATYSLVDFELLRERIYKNGERCMTEEVLKEFTLISFAFLWMDNGSFAQQAQYGVVHNEGYDFESTNNLRKWLETMGIYGNCRKVRSGEGKKLRNILSIPKREMERLSSLIAIYIHPTLRYKIHPKHRDLPFLSLKPDPRDYALIRIKKVEEVFIKDWRKYTLGTVYNISVRKWHNYFANGFNVGNCHHNIDYFARTAYLFFGRRGGLTASVSREDGMHPIFLGHMGPVFYKNLEQPLTPTVYFISVPVEYSWATALVHCADKNGEFNLTKMWGLLGEDDKFISACIQLIMKLLREGRKILFLSHRIVTLTHLYERLLPLIPEKVGLITGGEDISIRKDVLKTKRVSLGSMNLAKEGLDSKNLDTLIMEPCKAHGKKGEKESTTFQQATGRILRNYPKQAPKVYVLLPPYAPCYALCNTLKSWCRQRKTPFELIKEM